jgi:hypothetical protein
MGSSFITLAVLVSLLASQATSSGTEMLNRAEPSLDPDIRVVTAGGLWEQAGKYGSCRVVVRNLGWEHARSHVYLQWLLHDEASQSLSILNSVGIKELEAADWFTVESVAYDFATSKNQFVLNLRKRLDSSAVSAVIECKEPGKYVLKLPQSKQ